MPVSTISPRGWRRPRHLRRLFLRYLGTAAVAVAQDRRVHFAKKLIDETGLSMTQVALSAGFGSVRRFDAQFQKLYGRAPRELRRAARNGARPHPAGEYTFRLGYRPPYDWDSLIEFLAARAIPGVEFAAASGYRRTIFLEGRAGWIEVRPIHGAHALEVRIQYPDPAAPLFRIVERVRGLFDLRTDPGEIEAHLKRDAQLKSRRSAPASRTAGSGLLGRF